ncbi:MAG: hypothetical protein V4723_02655 [Pseudomonadota bacterium]
MNMLTSHRYGIGRLTVNDVLLIGFGIYWLCMLPSLFSDTPVRQAATRILLLPAFALMYWSTAQKMHQLARATAVLGNLRAPGALWQHLNAQGMQRVRLTWALLATGTTLQLALPGSATQALAGAALMSLAGSVALLHGVARSGALPLRTRTVDLVLLALALPLLVLWPRTAFDGFAALPAAVLALIVPAFPIALSLLEQRRRRKAPAYRWREPQRGRSLADSVLAHLRRYTVLIYNPNSETMGWSAAKQSVNPARLFFTVMPLLTTMTTSVATYTDGRLQVIRFMALLVMTMLLTSGLVVRDLHWRSFLMPGGLRKGRIGSSIFATTLLIQYGFIAAVLCVIAIGSQVAMGGSSPIVLVLLERHATLPLEIALATSIAVALRPVAKSPAWIVLCIAGIIVLAGYLTDFAATSGGYLALSPPLYAAALVGASAVLVLVSNHLWTMKRLFDISGWNKSA